MKVLVLTIFVLTVLGISGKAGAAGCELTSFGPGAGARTLVLDAKKENIAARLDSVVAAVEVYNVSGDTFHLGQMSLRDSVTGATVRYDTLNTQDSSGRLVLDLTPSRAAYSLTCH